jgi:hypothetical protein
MLHSGFKDKGRDQKLRNVRGLESKKDKELDSALEHLEEAKLC